VTYLTGDRVYEAVCNGHACSPRIFEEFPTACISIEVTAVSNSFRMQTPELNSKGLGIVAFDLEVRDAPACSSPTIRFPVFSSGIASGDRINVSLKDESSRAACLQR